METIGKPQHGVDAFCRDIARWHDYSGDCAEQDPRSFSTEAGIAARDDRDFSLKVNATDNIISRGGNAESRIYRLLQCCHIDLRLGNFPTNTPYFRCFFNISAVWCRASRTAGTWLIALSSP